MADDGIASGTANDGGIANNDGGIANTAPDGGIAGNDGGVASAPTNTPPAGDNTNTQSSPAPAPAPAPEAYELTAPDGFPIPAENLSSFSAKCKELGLSKAQAEGMLSWHQGFHGDVSKAMQQQEAAMLGSWNHEMAGDPEFGGTHMKQTVADARKALDAFDTDGTLRALLRDSNYQYNPAVIRAVARVGRAMGEHDFLAQSGQGSKEKPLEERLYPNMKI